MGFTVTQNAHIEIAAPPATVRAVFLDFERYSQWQDVFQIEPIKPGQKPADLQKGDQVRVNMRGFVFRPYIDRIDQDAFTWVGSIPVLLYGTHHFIFAPSEENPGGTCFIQREDFQGLTAWAFWPWRNSVKPSQPWADFNAGLKREAERIAASSRE